jgi:hypothetical protein
MKTDTKYHHVPRWFEYISQLGASLLVDATGKLFRDYDYIRRLQSQPKQPRDQPKTAPGRPPDELADESEDEEVVAPEVRAKRYKQEAKARHKQNQEALEAMTKAQPLLTLEYLVSSLSIFDVTNPHDSVYALLGIAKDTTPTAANKELRVTDHTQAVLEIFTAKKQYKVDYKASYIDICKEFIEFCVGRNVSRDPSRALDVICRPFAIDVEQKPHELCLPSWIPRLSKASYGMDRGPGIDGLRMGRKNADSLVGLPNLTHRNYNAAETKSLDRKVFRFRKRVPTEDSEKGADAGKSSQPTTSQLASSFAAQENETQEEAIEAASSASSQANGGSRNHYQSKSHATAQTKGVQKVALLPKLSSPAEPNNAQRSHPQPASSSAIQAKDAQAVLLPNARREAANSTKTGSSERSIDSKLVPTAFKSPLQSSQPNLNHFSLFVKGFVLDTIAKLQPSSQSGSIPTAWAHFAGWGEMRDTPPEHFWRTLVADRGSDGKNPPVYYSRACQESFRKGNTTSGVVDTTGLIDHERNSVVAQFCRRVQAAIWNRALMKTEAGRLGLAAANVKEHDLVCILYGCSVPVILRKHGPKNSDDIKNEMKWELKFLANYVGASYKSRLGRRRLFREKREKDKETYKVWELKKREQWKSDAIWTKRWKLVRAGVMRIHEFRAWVMKRRVMELEKANDSDAAKMSIESMRSYVHVLLSQMYEIAVWASESGDSDENVMDRLRSSNDDPTLREYFKLTEYQKMLWDLFRNDTEWSTWWQKTDENYRKAEGFRIWSRVHKKPIVYPEDQKKTYREWIEKPAQDWTTEWAAANSWFLSIDSFRAWLRERDKFYGPEEVLNNKQKWETDDEWHHNRDNNESEVESFNAWMNKKGLENPDLQESTIKEQKMRFEKWRELWLSDHSEATWQEIREAEQSQWMKIEQDLEQQKNEENDKRKKKAQKRDKEPFLERWRNGWKPEVVNWEEFETALSYGRHWLKLVKRGKRDYLRVQEQGWSELEAVKNRQSIRTDHLKRKKGNWAILYPNWTTETTAFSGAGKPVGIGSSNIIINEQVDTGSTPTHTPPRNSDPSTGVINDNTQAGAERVQGTFPDLRSQTVDASTIANHAGNEQSQLTEPTAQTLSQVSNSQRDSAEQGKNKQGTLHTPQISFTGQHDLTKRPSLERSQTEVALERIGVLLHAELEGELEHPFKSRQVLQNWVQEKKKKLPSLWQDTQTSIDRHLARWERRTPGIMGKDGEFNRDLRLPSKGEKEQREKEKLERKERIDRGEDVEEETDDEADNGRAEKMTEEKEDEKVKGKAEEKSKEEGVGKALENVTGEDRGRGQEIEKSKAEKKNYGCIRRRQRLKKREKAEYEQIIEANFITKMGDDGQWYYEMMGECYVHGMMDGEAMAHQNNEGISTTVFEIR